MCALDGRIIRTCYEIAIDEDASRKVHLALEDGRIKLVGEVAHDRSERYEKSVMGESIKVSLYVGRPI